MPRFGTAFCTRAASACLSPRALVVILGLSFAQPAHAYLDPASGGLLLQAAVAGLLAGMFTLKMYWVKVQDWFRVPPRAKAVGAIAALTLVIVAGVALTRPAARKSSPAAKVAAPPAPTPVAPVAGEPVAPVAPVAPDSPKP